MAKLTVEDAKRVLKEDVGFSDDQIAGLSADQLKKIADGYMRQSDYDRSLAESQTTLQAQQAELTAANDRLNNEIAAWAETQAEGGKITQKMRADMERAEADALKLRHVVTRLATEAGKDPAAILAEAGSVVVPPTQPTTGNPPDLSGYVKSDDLSAHLGSLARAALHVPATYAYIAREHKKLTGEDIDERGLANEIEKRANTRGNQKSLDPVAVWEELHGIPEKRTAAEAKRVQDLVDAARAEGRQAGLSEISVPGAHTPTGRHAPIFAKDAPASKLQRPQPGQTVGAAASALRSGKYRQPA
jgi:hypothetical protein